MFYINISTYELAEGHGHRTGRTGSKLRTRGSKRKSGGWGGEGENFLLPFLFTWCEDLGVGTGGWAPASPSEGAGVVSTPRLYGLIKTAEDPLSSDLSKRRGARPGRAAGPGRLQELPRGAPAPLLPPQPSPPRPGPARRRLPGLTQCRRRQRAALPHAAPHTPPTQSGARSPAHPPPPGTQLSPSPPGAAGGEQGPPRQMWQRLLPRSSRLSPRKVCGRSPASRAWKCPGVARGVAAGRGGG